MLHPDCADQPFVSERGDRILPARVVGPVVLPDVELQQVDTVESRGS